MPAPFRQTYKCDRKALKKALDGITKAMARNDPDDTENLPEAPHWEDTVAVFFETKRDDVATKDED